MLVIEHDAAAPWEPIAEESNAIADALVNLTNQIVQRKKARVRERSPRQHVREAAPRSPD